MSAFVVEISQRAYAELGCSGKSLESLLEACLLVDKIVWMMRWFEAVEPVPKRPSEAEVLRQNPEEILSQRDVRSSSEVMTVRRVMEAGDIQSLEILLHHGRGWHTRRAIFAREIFELIVSNPNSAKIIIEQLAAWFIIDENFLISLRHLFERGSHEVVRMLLDCNIESQVQRTFGINLLVNVFGNAKVNVAELFETRDLDVDAQDFSGETALHAAVDNNLLENVRLLLDRGADPNAKDCVGWTPMFVVKSFECMELLLEYGANVQAVDKDGYTIFDGLALPLDVQQDALATLAIFQAKGTPIKQLIHERILSKQILRDFYEDCQQQIDCMKDTIILGSYDLFSVLCDDTDTVLRNPKIVSSILDETTRDSRQGYVFHLLERRYRKKVLQTAHLPGENSSLGSCESRTAIKIIHHLTFEALLLILFIVFNAIRIYFK